DFEGLGREYERFNMSSTNDYFCRVTGAIKSAMRRDPAEFSWRACCDLAGAAVELALRAKYIVYENIARTDDYSGHSVNDHWQSPGYARENLEQFMKLQAHAMRMLKEQASTARLWELQKKSAGKGKPTPTGSRSRHQKAKPTQKNENRRRRGGNSKRLRSKKLN